MLQFLSTDHQGTLYEILTVLLVLTLIFLAVFKRAGAAFVVFLAIALFVLMSRPELNNENTTFQAGMLKITIQQAQATISQMQQMAGLLGETVINVDRFSGELGGIPINLKKEHRTEVGSILSSIGAGPEAISKVTRAEHDQDADTKMSNIVTAVETKYPNELNALLGAENKVYPQSVDQDGLLPPEIIQGLLKQFNMTDPVVIKALKDYSDFYNDPEKVEN